MQNLSFMGISPIHIKQILNKASPKGATRYVYAYNSPEAPYVQPDNNTVFLCDFSNDYDVIATALILGGHVKLAKGDFNLRYSIPHVSDTWLQGSGRGLTKLKMADGISGFYGLKLDGVTNSMTSDLTIDGQKASQTTLAIQTGIGLVNSSDDNDFWNLEVKDVGDTDLAGTGYGIILDGSSRNRIFYSRLSGCIRENLCIFSGSQYNTASHIIASSSGDRNVVMHDSSYNTLDDCISISSTIEGIDVQGTGANAIGNKLHNCKVFTSGTDGIIVRGGGGYVAQAIIDGCYISGSGSCGVEFRSGSKDSSLTNSEIISSAQYAVWVLATSINTRLEHNKYSLSTISNVRDDTASARIWFNTGYIGKGEERSYSGPLKQVAQNGAVMVWQNPEAEGMLVTSKIRVTTGAGAAADGSMGLNATNLVVEDCEDAWSESAGAHVTSTSNTTDFERGSGSASIAFTTGVVNDEMATEVVAKNLAAYTHITLKIKPSASVAAGDLRLLLDDHASCASPLETLDLPALTTGVWNLVCLILADPASDTAIISVGLQYHLNAKVNTILVDDVRAITIGATMFDGGGGCDLATAGIYDSMNITDAGAGLGKPVSVDAKNGTNDMLILKSATAASSSIVGSYYLQAVGV